METVRAEVEIFELGAIIKTHVLCVRLVLNNLNKRRNSELHTPHRRSLPYCVTSIIHHYSKFKILYL